MAVLPVGDDVRILFARCRIGLPTAADPCGIGTDASFFCRGVLPRFPTRSVFARHPFGQRRLLSALGPWVHTTPRRFPSRCYAHFRTWPIHPVRPPPLSGDDQMQPSYCFQGCHPYSLVIPAHYVPPWLSPRWERGVRAGPWPFLRQRGSFSRAIAPSGPRPTSHSPACAHLSERCLAHADYSCRRGSSVDSTAQGVTPDFIHPPFGPTGLPPGRFVAAFVTQPFG